MEITEVCCENDFSTSQFNDKNIPRRVYDALNVLEALDIITRVKKEIKWNGIPDRKMDLEGMKVSECHYFDHVINML